MAVEPLRLSPGSPVAPERGGLWRGRLPERWPSPQCSSQAAVETRGPADSSPRSTEPGPWGHWAAERLPGQNGGGHSLSKAETLLRLDGCQGAHRFPVLQWSSQAVIVMTRPACPGYTILWCSFPTESVFFPALAPCLCLLHKLRETSSFLFLLTLQGSVHMSPPPRSLL